MFKESKFVVRKYQTEDFLVWNAFVASAKNATFLFDRGFMDYHADRFADFSLMFFENKILVGVLPAHVFENNVFSHNGLTYGGLVLDGKLRLEEVVNVFAEILKFLNQQGVYKLFLKQLPSIYADVPSDEMEYALFLCNAKLWRRDSLSVIDLQYNFKISKGRKQGINRGKLHGLLISETADFSDFWNDILIPNLKRRHNTKPVHSLAEITKLKGIFADNIRHFNVYDDGVLIAGTTIFVTKNVIHPQYISAVEDRNNNGCLDFLYYYLITDVFKDAKYFDFGISNESDGRKLNKNLVFWKESYGASTIIQNFYEVQTADYELLNDFLI
jgi:hypothetical protein